jgi:hypothetical protein
MKLQAQRYDGQGIAYRIEATSIREAIAAHEAAGWIKSKGKAQGRWRHGTTTAFYRTILSVNFYHPETRRKSRLSFWFDFEAGTVAAEIDARPEPAKRCRYCDGWLSAIEAQSETCNACLDIGRANDEPERPTYCEHGAPLGAYCGRCDRRVGGDRFVRVDIYESEANARARGHHATADATIDAGADLWIAEDSGRVFFVTPLLALPAATGDLAEQQRTIGDAIDRRAEELGFDYGALRVDRRMRWLMAESSEIIARRWRADVLPMYAGERLAA